MKINLNIRSIALWDSLEYLIKFIKIIPFIVIIILLFYFILYGSSITNLNYNLLNGTHDLPCSI